MRGYRHLVPSPPPDASAFVTRVKLAAAAGDVETTGKADDEMIELGWERSDLLSQLVELEVEDFLRTERSRYDDTSVLWVFCPPHWDGGYLWLRLRERGGRVVVVVSIHPAEGDPWSQ